MAQFDWGKHPEVQQFVRDRMAESMPNYVKYVVREVHKKFGSKHPALAVITSDGIKSAVARHQLSPSDEGVDADRLASILTAKERLAKENKALRNARDVFAEVVRAELVPYRRFKVPKKPRGKRARDAEAMCMLFGDSQVGTLIEAAQVAGLGGFDWDKLREYAKVWVEKNLLLLSIQRKDHPVTSLKIFGVGDYVEGEAIFRGQQWYTDRNLQRQLVCGSHVFAQAIGDIARLGEFPDGVDLYMIPGNHGRLGMPGEIQANADDLFIDFLEFAFRGNPQIRMHHSSSPLMAFQMFGRWNILLTHGNETVAWNQIPWYGLARDALKQQALARRPIHYKIIGHHHQAVTFPISADMTVMANGSWPGPSNLGVVKMKSALPPVQWTIFMHPTIGRTALYDVRLGELPTWEPDNHGIYTPCYPPITDPED